MGSEQEELLDQVFSTWPSPPDPPATFQERVYPELLLHQAPHAGQYYGSLQQVARQFDDDSKNIMNFASCNLGSRLREKVHAWDSIDSEGPNTSKEQESNPGTMSSRSGANSLFSWSTSDTLIAARKRQLQERSTVSLSLNGSISNGSELVDLPLPSMAGSRRLAMRQLPRIVEAESDKFIQDRIDIIKAHHKNEASKKIDERKRRDHEMHLQRIKRKEAEYERSLRAAIALQSTNRLSGFFGSIFGILKQNSSSFTLDMLEPAPYPSPTSGTPPPHSRAASPSKFNRSSFLPFRAFNKSATSSPQSTRAKTSLDDTTRSFAGSEDTRDSNRNDHAAAFEGLSIMLDSLSDLPSKNDMSPPIQANPPYETNPLDDILSSPIDKRFSGSHFIALEPQKLPVTKK